jgi:hypothetical protein
LAVALLLATGGTDIFKDSSSSDSTPNYQTESLIHQTWLPISAGVCLLAIGAAGFGTYYLLTHNINHDSIGCVYGEIALTTGISITSLGTLIWEAASYSKTDFTGAILAEAKLKRTAFQNAKSTDAEIEKVNWL